MSSVINGGLGGPIGLDPWSDNNMFHNSLGGMYQHGGLSGAMPSIRTMYGADAQMYYAQSAHSPAGQEHRRAIYAGADDSFLNFISKNVVGTSYELGQSRTTMNNVFAEQSMMTKTQVGGFMANVGVNTAAGVGSIYVGGIPGLALGVAGHIAGSAINAGIETRFANMARQKEVIGELNRIRTGDGTIGTSKRETVDVTKFLGKTAADDPLLDIEDVTSAFIQAAEDGIRSSSTSGDDVKRITGNYIDNMKKLMDIMGKTDFKEVAGILREYQNLGIKMDTAVELNANISTFSNLTGMSQSTVTDFNRQAMMSASSQTISESSISRNFIGTLTDVIGSMGINGKKSGSGRLNSNEAKAAATEEINRSVEAYLGDNYNLSSDQKKIYAQFKSKHSGETIEYEMGQLNKKSLKEQTATVTTLANEFSSDNEKMIYSSLISDKRKAKDRVDQTPELSNLNDRVGKTMNDPVKLILSKLDSLGLARTKDNASMIINETTPNISTQAKEAWVGMVQASSTTSGQRKMEANAKIQEEALATKIYNQKMDRKFEQHSLAGIYQKAKGNISNFFRNIVGGFDVEANLEEGMREKEYGSAFSQSVTASGAQAAIMAGAKGIELDDKSKMKEYDKIKGERLLKKETRSYRMFQAGRGMKNVNNRNILFDTGMGDEVGLINDLRENETGNDFISDFTGNNTHAAIASSMLVKDRLYGGTQREYEQLEQDDKSTVNLILSEIKKMKVFKNAPELTTKFYAMSALKGRGELEFAKKLSKKHFSVNPNKHAIRIPDVTEVAKISSLVKEAKKTVERSNRGTITPDDVNVKGINTPQEKELYAEVENKVTAKAKEKIISTQKSLKEEYKAKALQNVVELSEGKKSNYIDLELSPSVKKEEQKMLARTDDSTIVKTIQDVKKLKQELYMDETKYNSSDEDIAHYNMQNETVKKNIGGLRKTLSKIGNEEFEAKALDLIGKDMSESQLRKGLMSFAEKEGIEVDPQDLSKVVSYGSKITENAESGFFELDRTAIQGALRGERKTRLMKGVLSEQTREEREMDLSSFALFGKYHSKFENKDEAEVFATQFKAIQDTKYSDNIEEDDKLRREAFKKLSKGKDLSYDKISNLFGDINRDLNGAEIAEKGGEEVTKGDGMIVSEIKTTNELLEGLTKTMSHIEGHVR